MWRHSDEGIFTIIYLVFSYIAYTQTVQRSTYSYLHWGERLVRSDFVWGDLLALLVRRGHPHADGALTLARRRLSPATMLIALAPSSSSSGVTASSCARFIPTTR